MKSERRPGCACFSASAASSIFRQNTKRVAIAGAGPMSHSDLTVVLRRGIGPWMGFESGRSRAKVFLSTPASARRMTDPSVSPLAELESAVQRSKSDRATAAALDAIRVKVPLMEVVRTAARAFVTHYDGASGVAPRSLVALSSAANLMGVMQPRFQPLPILQAVSFVAAAKKADAPARPAAVRSEERREGKSVDLG